jgi:hypothetical protein
MSRKGLVLVFGAVVLTLVAAVVLLATGGADEPSRIVDPVGDAVIGEGDNPPTNAALADIQTTEVRRDGDEIVFTASVGEPLPDELDEGHLRIRWNLSEGGGWSVLFNLGPGSPVAQVVGQGSQFGASTLDGTFPGDFEINARTVTLRLTYKDISQWPDDFTWATSTELGTSAEQGSALASDRAPDEGFGSLGD